MRMKNIFTFAAEMFGISVRDKSKRLVVLKYEKSNRFFSFSFWDYHRWDLPILLHQARPYLPWIFL